MAQLSIRHIGWKIITLPVLREIDADRKKTIEINNGSFNDRDGPVNNNRRRRVESSIFRFEIWR